MVLTIRCSRRYKIGSITFASAQSSTKQGTCVVGRLAIGPNYSLVRELKFDSKFNRVPATVTNQKACKNHISSGFSFLSESEYPLCLALNLCCIRQEISKRNGASFIFYTFPFNFIVVQLCKITIT